MADLNPVIRSLTRFAPLEDFLLLALAPFRALGVKVQSRLEIQQTFPLILVRRAPSYGGYTSSKFFDDADFYINAFCEGLNGDEDAAMLSDAVRDLLRKTYEDQTVFTGPLGLLWMGSFEVRAPAKYVPDWASATGPVQYADLPQGVFRYEALYTTNLRRQPGTSNANH